LGTPLDGADLDPACERAARDAAKVLESMGHAVEEIEPPWAGLDLLSDFTRAFGPMVAMTVFVGGRIARREPTQADVEPLTWMLWERAHTQDVLGYLAAQGRLESVARTVVRFLDQFDVVITPALARPPVAIGEIHGLGPDAWAHYQRGGHFTPYTGIVNVCGLPAVSLPLYQSDGLPLGVQLIGRAAGEGALLAVSAALEAALPWAERRPSLTSSSR
jgi:amidase